MALDRDPLNTNIEGISELVIFWKYPEIDLQCKSMLDRIVIDHKQKIIRLIDVKTSSNIGNFNESFENYKYYRQLSFYWMALHYALTKGELKDKVSNIDEYKKETYILALSTKEVPEARLYEIDENYLNLGLSEIEEIIPKIKWHFDNNKWNHTKESYENNGIEKLKYT